MRPAVPSGAAPATVLSCAVKMPVEGPVSVSVTVSVSPVRSLTTSTTSVPVPAMSASSTESWTGSPTMPALTSGTPSVPPTVSMSVIVWGTLEPLAASL